MTISNASQRLQTIMLERGLKQVDILEKSIPLQKSLGIKGLTDSSIAGKVNTIYTMLIIYLFLIKKLIQKKRDALRHLFSF